MNGHLHSATPDARDIRSHLQLDIAPVPSGPLAAARAIVADKLLRRAAARLPVRVVYPDGSVVGAADTSLPTMRVRRPAALARRLGRSGLIGFGEAYMDGDWDCDNLAGFLTPWAASMGVLIPPILQRFRHLAVPRVPQAQRNEPPQAQRNVAHHYDLSNDFFALFLDDTMTYSCALFDHIPGTAGGLADAQRRKIDRLLDHARVGLGTRVLEIGTGWGQLCVSAAARGAHVRSVTLSNEQQKLALQRVEAAGLSDRVQVELCDYRDIQGQYDAIVSVEMIEAVGFDFWTTYFQTIDTLLKPGGRFALQTITMPHERMLASRSTHTWIQKYIFPGGLLPSVRAIAETTANSTHLRTVEIMSLRPHYAETLRLWSQQFAAQRESVSALGFDDAFYRMWQLYLAYSEAGFSSGYLDVHQWIFQRGQQ
ncbi:methyltransferase, cyclopropane fatty acid synthase [Mycobacteroides abscessus subsp. abscessus]|uniref:class I SAM-dependent methyltransferase n=1 Tax=Mycobacteroides abscessus TaxID=36809 RepID=UPI00092B80DF|nr:class I SAM-dependent methyltransferase [Mycobacteroides abscessus]SHS53435.1 methyltransferase, cyclopropane fatty acid synthase [Mycobacteroides abscessus subsp. abscessus]SHT91531.1 methyltransferase, cyclopropane fatty acid synthase [Mycobacteroides abscessus subsp. abscessus]SHU03047.1 methyltransferase, cyclopropane fatty acid synthase [Mycobacteroides abscessus subsp. abscessus]SHW22842.1 methyltransferase, cyclopropane fatty acid synthase [Mycobacteroides abscessus subsp. abscessus]